MGEYDFPKTSANNKFFISEANVFANPLALFGDGSDGNVTISSNTDAAVTRAMHYNNLTIDSTFNLYNDSAKIFIIFVKGTLTLNGNIHMNGKGIAGGEGATGGTAGGNLFIFANKIVGNGTISANGVIGTTAGNNDTVGSGYFEANSTYALNLVSNSDFGDAHITSTGGAGGTAAIGQAFSRDIIKLL